MAVLAFVLVFVLLGLGAFFFAMAGGPRSARDRERKQSRRGGRGVVVLFLLSIVVLGAAVPAAVIATDKDRDSIPEANITHLTALQKKGQELFGERCRKCHTLKAANATGKTGPDLDAAPRSKALVLEAIANGRFAGNGNMPSQVYTGEDAEAVAEFVAVATGGSLENPEPSE